MIIEQPLYNITYSNKYYGGCGDGLIICEKNNIFIFYILYYDKWKPEK